MSQLRLIVHCGLWWGIENLRGHWVLTGKLHSNKTSSNAGFVDTAKFPGTRTYFFFIYLKQMLSEKWQEGTPAKISLCLFEKSLLLCLRQNFTSWDWQERAKAVPHLEMSVFLPRIQEKRKYCSDLPSNYITNARLQQHRPAQTLLNLWDVLCP